MKKRAACFRAGRPFSFSGSGLFHVKPDLRFAFIVTPAKAGVPLL
jgi:hypothetical protein